MGKSSHFHEEHGGNRVRASLRAARTLVDWRRRLGAPRGFFPNLPAHRRKGRGHPMRNYGAHAASGSGVRVFLNNKFIKVCDIYHKKCDSGWQVANWGLKL